MKRSCVVCIYSAVTPCPCKYTCEIGSDARKTIATDNAVLLETIRDLAATRERLGRASGHITAARVYQEGVVAAFSSVITYQDIQDFLRDATAHLAALVAAEKEIADENPRDGC